MERKVLRIATALHGFLSVEILSCISEYLNSFDIFHRGLYSNCCDLFHGNICT